MLPEQCFWSSRRGGDDKETTMKTPTDEAGIIAHARRLAAEQPPGELRATLLALVEQNARLAAEGDTLWAVADNQSRKVIRLRRTALLLRDAWRAERRKLAGARETAAWAAQQEAERDAWQKTAI